MGQKETAGFVQVSFAKPGVLGSYFWPRLRHNICTHTDISYIYTYLQFDELESMFEDLTCQLLIHPPMPSW